MVETHIQICTERRDGVEPIIYHGKFNDMDFINRDVIAGELLNHVLAKLHEYDMIKENPNKFMDNGQKIVIKFWKEQVKSMKNNHIK